MIDALELDHVIINAQEVATVSINSIRVHCVLDCVTLEGNLQSITDRISLHPDRKPQFSKLFRPADLRVFHILECERKHKEEQCKSQEANGDSSTSKYSFD